MRFQNLAMSLANNGFFNDGTAFVFALTSFAINNQSAIGSSAMWRGGGCRGGGTELDPMSLAYVIKT